jgi:winged helix DNA-binding protein
MTDIGSGIDLVAATRLRRQRIAEPGRNDPAAIVASLGAVQAQDYGAAKWAIGLRTRKPITDAMVERAFNDGRILRTHVLRPTWHFVTAADIRWMLKLTAARVHRALAWGHRQLELDAALRTRAASCIERALGDGGCLTRAELAAALARRKIVVSGVRLALLMIHAELEGVICSGPLRDRKHTYALLATRAAGARDLSGDEALAELATRFFSSHGPATIRDFTWWSGLTTADAKRAIEASGARSIVAADREFRTFGSDTPGRPDAGVHLLPMYDEYLVAYRDHEAVPRAPAAWGLLPATVIAGGYVAGSWKAQQARGASTVRVRMHRPLRPPEQRALAATAERYGRFLEVQTTVTLE